MITSGRTIAGAIAAVVAIAGAVISAAGPAAAQLRIAAEARG